MTREEEEGGGVHKKMTDDGDGIDFFSGKRLKGSSIMSNSSQGNTRTKLICDVFTYFNHILFSYKKYI